MTTFAEPMVHDELESVIANLCAKYPQRSQAEVEAVVARVYAELSAKATVTAHLIPLTQNASRRVLTATSAQKASGESLPAPAGAH